MEGTTKARVHSRFRRRLEQLQIDEALRLADAFCGTEQRVWQIPLSVQPLRLTDPAKLHTTAWDRTAINENYLQCVAVAGKEAGTSGDVIALKLQSDYLAAEERAFRARHSTLCRNLVHLHGRRDGQGQSELFPQIVRQVQNVIKAGGTA